ncbi:MAG: TolC family protein [Acidobacteria bacterium]|nr:TolC family protein [Acidobacteriota bacterium]MBI3487275.1 TolC family protein [Acidobacteriota bacterium]
MSIKLKLPWMLVGAGLLAQEPLTVAEAIQRAWKDQAGLRAGQALVEARQADAEALRGLRLPSLTLSANGVRTNEPMQTFGIKLNQARITASDFNPASLNHPDPISAFGGTFVVQQPLYAGGRIRSASRAGAFMAQAEQASQERRKQETAQLVVEAYFGAQAAEQALAWADETLAWVRGLQAFVDARVAQGLMLEAEAQRLKAAQAQVEAQRAEAQARVRNARSGLGLLTGSGPFQGSFATQLASELPEAAPEGKRADVAAASLQAQAAQEQAKAASGSLRPEVGLELGAGALHQSWSEKGNWTWAAVGVKWRVFSAPDRSKANAARAQARAAEESRTFKQQQAEHEVRVAREGILAAEARVAAARQAMAAAEESKRLREARHREGLTPLTDVLDAEAARQGARALLLQSLYDLRTSRAALDLATGAPIEGVKP